MAWTLLIFNYEDIDKNVSLIFKFYFYVYWTFVINFCELTLHILCSFLLLFLFLSEFIITLYIPGLLNPCL